MRLTDDDAWTRLAGAAHGVLSTVHATRGVDAVPVVFAADASNRGDRRVVIPVDSVKAKTTTRLQRERNLEADPRASLLVDQWDAEDWSRLWWVRADLRFESTIEPDARPDEWAVLAAQLAARYRQYAGAPFAKLLALRVAGLTGWAAGGG